jgi:hypothetical protein
MLKIYNIKDYVSIDGGDWREVGGWGHRVADDAKAPDSIHLGQMSFDETHKYLSENSLCGVCKDSTFFRHKPTIRVRYNDAFDDVTYQHFNTFAYKRTFVEMEDVSMEWIMKNLSADQCIQYLKERGMTACPILK